MNIYKFQHLIKYMGKIVFAIALTLILIVSGTVLYFMENKPIQEDFSNGLFYGPVPQGYDETHFRETGEMIKEGDKE